MIRRAVRDGIRVHIRKILKAPNGLLPIPLTFLVNYGIVAAGGQREGKQFRA
jgi:hypothetical protein